MLDETKSSVSDFTNDLKLIKALLLHENNCGRTALVTSRKSLTSGTVWRGNFRMIGGRFRNQAKEIPLDAVAMMGDLAVKEKYCNFARQTHS